MTFDLKGYKPSRKILLQSGMILLGTFLLVVILEIQDRCSEEEITYIERNEYDAGVKKEELELEIEGEKAQTVILEISPKSPSGLSHLLFLIPVLLSLRQHHIRFFRYK